MTKTQQQLQKQLQEGKIQVSNEKGEEKEDHEWKICQKKDDSYCWRCMKIYNEDEKKLSKEKAKQTREKNKLEGKVYKKREKKQKEVEESSESQPTPKPQKKKTKIVEVEESTPEQVIKQTKKHNNDDEVDVKKLLSEMSEIKNMLSRPPKEQEVIKVEKVIENPKKDVEEVVNETPLPKQQQQQQQSKNPNLNRYLSK